MFKYITAIEILDKDEFKSKVKFLSVDLNYIDGYSQYIGQDVFMLEHPEGKIIHICAGRIIRFINDENDKPNYRFEHSLSTEHGSSGSPLILLYNERVIGVHRGVVSEEKEKDGKKITIERNFGSFIGEMINAINDKIDEDRQLKEKKNLKKNRKK